MVRKNYKWNISKEEGEKIIGDKISEILSDKGEMEISELNFLFKPVVEILPLKIIRKKRT